MFNNLQVRRQTLDSWSALSLSEKRKRVLAGDTPPSFPPHPVPPERFLHWAVENGFGDMTREDLERETALAEELVTLMIELEGHIELTMELLKTYGVDSADKLPQEIQEALEAGNVARYGVANPMMRIW